MTTISTEEQQQYAEVDYPASGKVYHKEPLGNDFFLANNRQLQDVAKLLPEGAAIAGGYLADIITQHRRPKDMDVFFFKPFAADEMAERLLAAGYRKGSKTVSGCQEFNMNHMKGLEVPVQLVEFHSYKSVEHMLDGFDFTAAQFATDGQYLWSGPEATRDAFSKVINLHRPSSYDKDITYQRILRYMAKGFTLSREALMTLWTYTPAHQQ